MTKEAGYRRTWLYRLGSLVVVSIALLSSCSKSDGDANPALTVPQPANFPGIRYSLSGNPVTQKGFELGRKLFYDGLLSRDGSISCGNCHQQAGAFSHIDHTVSHGIDDRLGTRNSPALQNLAFYRTFMWDGGIFNLDLQPIAPIESHVEMDETMGNVVQKLNRSSDYRNRFRSVFGVDSISSRELMKALSQFMVMLVSNQSKYDQVQLGKAGVAFTADEAAGLQLFRNQCASCHATELFTDLQFRNNGLPPTQLNDVGRYAITLQDHDRYRFSVPSLRNVEKTAPYMHDGRFRTLEAVLDHYSSGVQNSATLDPILLQNGQLGLPLTAQEKQQIISFLKTLTDDNFLHDPRFAEQ